jgi:DNA adenine methylase
MTTRLAPPLKWHGGKHYLAHRIVALMPPHIHYVEPYAGGFAVLLARDPDERRLWAGTEPGRCGVSEVANDLDGRLMNFWRVLQQEDTFRRFARTVQAVPLSRAGWAAAHAHVHDGRDPVADAVAFFCDCRQSLAGRIKSFTALTRSRTRRGINGNASEWLSAVDGLPAVHERLRRVILEDLPALDVIRREDSPGTFFYCDPPYLPETRTATDISALEMSAEDHRALLDALLRCQGKVMLSGYASALYDTALRGWTRHTFELPNNAAGGKKKRRATEVLWCNF